MAKTKTTPTDQGLILPMCAIFRRFLKGKGLKFTQERAKILDAVLAKEEVFEADELTYEMREMGHRVSRATIYRTLKHLLEAGIISEILIDSNQAHYQLTFGREPKGHLVCVETGRIIEFSTSELDALKQRICEAHGFDPVNYRFVVYGVSPEAKEEQD